MIFDTPNRQQPYAHQATVGYSRELARNIAVGADYVHAANRDMFLARNLNPMLRANTTASRGRSPESMRSVCSATRTRSACG